VRRREVVEYFQIGIYVWFNMVNVIMFNTMTRDGLHGSALHGNDDSGIPNGNLQL